MKRFLILVCGIAIVIVFIASCSGGDLPEPKNGACSPPCYIRIIHPTDRSRYDAGRNYEIVDYNNVEVVAHHEMYPYNQGFPIPAYEDIEIPCGRNLIVKVWYYEKCPSPFDEDLENDFVEYNYVEAVSPTACTHEVYAQALFNRDECP